MSLYRNLKSLLYLVMITTVVSACGPGVEFGKEVVIKDVVASSSKLEATRPDLYSPFFLVDGDGTTSWCEGKDDYGSNESVFIRLQKPIRFNKIYLYNGYQSGAKGGEGLSHGMSSEKLADAQFRSQPVISHLMVTATLTAKNKKTVTKMDRALEIPLDKGYQVLTLPKTLEGNEIQLEIKIINPVKNASWLKDVCMTDIRFGYIDQDKADKNIPVYPTVFEHNGVRVTWDKYKSNALMDIWNYVSLNSYYKMVLESDDFRKKQKMELVSPDDMNSTPNLVLKPNQAFEIRFGSETDAAGAKDDDKLPEKLMVNAAVGLKLYTEGKADSTQIGSVPQNAVVDVLQRSPKKGALDGAEDFWYLVMYQDQKGWAFGKSLTTAPVTTSASSDEKKDNSAPVSLIYSGTYKPLHHTREDGLQVQFSGSKNAEATSIAGDPQFKCMGYIKYLEKKEEITEKLNQFKLKPDANYKYIWIHLRKDQCQDGQPPMDNFIKIVKKK